MTYRTRLETLGPGESWVKPWVVASWFPWDMVGLFWLAHGDAVATSEDAGYCGA